MKWLCQHVAATSLALVILFFGNRVVAADARHVELDENRQSGALELSLDDAIALALRENRGVQAAYLQRISQKFDLYVSEGKFLPKLVLTTGLLENKVDGLTSRTKDVATNATLNLPTGAKLSLATTNGWECPWRRACSLEFIPHLRLRKCRR